MRTQTVKATNTPIRDTPYGRYTCARCGIQPHRGKSKGAYCRDCKPYTQEQA